MEVRRAEEKDLARILEIYAIAREKMRESGNPNQWGDTYPQEELVRQDIALGQSYVITEQGRIEAVFVYFAGEDSTYRRIEDGAWLNDRPYGVMHRVASGGGIRGAASECIQWCFRQCGNLRGDTYKDNQIMQHVMEKNGFVRCGTIYLSDGSPRIAYQKIS